MVKRQFPNPKDVFEYLQLKRPEFGKEARVLEQHVGRLISHEHRLVRVRHVFHVWTVRPRPGYH